MTSTTEHPDREAIAEDLRAVAAHVGGAPSVREYGWHGEYPKEAIYDRFDSFVAALDAAGIDIDGDDDRGRSPRGVPDEVIIADLRRVADELGRPPELVEYREHGKHAYSTIREHFGSYAEAIEAAGMNTDDVSIRKGPSPIPKAKLVADLQRVAAVLEEIPTPAEYNTHGEYSATTIYRRFGSFDRGLDEAELSTC